ncbi:MAG TPA: PIN domain-containing protein, partial [Candidatus Kapabacteria bacterium]|nr:PIN domain-containing protein [Candidatus Kapabacteria bacterium]
MNRILIDSDVILDVFLNRIPFAKFSAQILSLCDLKLIKGFITPVICSNLYYILRKSKTHKDVIALLKELISITDILIIDKEVIIDSINSDFQDFEDSMQHFAAYRSNNIELIITRNIVDYRKSLIPV